MIRKQRSCFKEGTVNYASPFNPEYALWKGSTASDLFCHILELQNDCYTMPLCRNTKQLLRKAFSGYNKTLSHFKVRQYDAAILSIALAHDVR